VKWLLDSNVVSEPVRENPSSAVVTPDISRALALLYTTHGMTNFTARNWHDAVEDPRLH
jgi:hypothetical protein